MADLFVKSRRRCQSIAFRLFPRTRLTRPLFATAPHDSDGLLADGADLLPLQETLLYVERNPVRAGLTDLPEEWKGGSAFLRKLGQEDFLIPLEQIFPQLATEKVFGYYRALQLQRGLDPTKENQASIPLEILQKELKRGFPTGLYRKRCRGFIDGLMLGQEADMRRELERMVLDWCFQSPQEPEAAIRRIALHDPRTALPRARLNFAEQPSRD